jgi:hypothetical protein
MGQAKKVRALAEALRQVSTAKVAHAQQEAWMQASKPRAT